MSSNEAQTGSENNNHYQLRLQESWEGLAGTPEQEIMRQLIILSRESLLQSPEPPGWAGNIEEVTYRWQQTAEYMSLPFSDDEAQLTLTDGIHRLKSFIDTYGWVEEGIVLNFLDRYTRPGRLTELDIRKMGPAISVVPMEFEEFKALSDAEVDAIQTAHRTNAENHSGRIGSMYPPEAQVASDYLKLTEFRIWRKHGKPDREVNYRDTIAYLKELNDYRIAQDPDFGKLPAEFETMEVDDRRLVAYVFEYFDTMRDIAEDLIIDSYSLSSTLGLEDKDVQKLVDNGVLEFEGDYHVFAMGKLGHFRLARPYYDFWLVNRVAGHYERSQQKDV